jgi:hypothetical protein
MAKVSLTGSAESYYATDCDVSPDVILRHEERHIATIRGDWARVEQLATALRQQTFPDKPACDAACAALKRQIYRETDSPWRAWVIDFFETESKPCHKR